MTKHTRPSPAAMDWRAWLEDPADANDERLDPRAARAIRRAVVAAAQETPSPVTWPRPLAVVIIVILMIGMGAGLGQRFEPAQPAAPGAVEEVKPSGGARQQLQFATPGGTRIIWVFNPDLDLKATMP